MDLKNFVKNVLVDLDAAVDEAGKKSKREIRFCESDGARTVEFDIAVTAEDEMKTSGKAGVRVLHFVETGGDVHKEAKSSTVSRVQFGVRIGVFTKEEDKKDEQVTIKDPRDSFEV